MAKTLGWSPDDLRGPARVQRHLVTLRLEGRSGRPRSRYRDMWVTDRVPFGRADGACHAPIVVGDVPARAVLASRGWSPNVSPPCWPNWPRSPSASTPPDTGCTWSAAPFATCSSAPTPPDRTSTSPPTPGRPRSAGRSPDGPTPCGPRARRSAPSVPPGPVPTAPSAATRSPRSAPRCTTRTRASRPSPSRRPSRTTWHGATSRSTRWRSR